MSPLRPLAVLILVAACGADGPPVAPARDIPQAPEANLSLGANTPETGVTVGGDMRVGVVYEE